MAIRVRPILLQLIVTGVCLVAVLVLFELYLRQSTTHVILQQLDQAGGVVETSPEFLVDFSRGNRRFVPGAAVVIKNHYFSGLDVPININSLGFRDDEISLERNPGEIRVLVLGDSITVADYLPVEQTYPEQLQALLAQRFPERTTEVVNAGIGNIGLEEEREILEERGLELRPDLVLIGFYLNDSRPPWGFSGEIGNRGWLRRKSLLLETVLRTLEEQRWSEEKEQIRFGWIELQNQLDWKNDRKAFLELAKAAEFDWGAAWQDESWGTIETELRRVHDLAKKHGFQVAVVGFPVRFQVESEFLEAGPQQRLAALVEQFGFSYLDLLPVLRQHRDEPLYYDHCHPNARGFEIIASVLADHLAPQLQASGDTPPQ